MKKMKKEKRICTFKQNNKRYRSTLPRSCADPVVGAAGPCPPPPLTVLSIIWNQLDVWGGHFKFLGDVVTTLGKMCYKNRVREGLTIVHSKIKKDSHRRETFTLVTLFSAPNHIGPVTLL